MHTLILDKYLLFLSTKEIELYSTFCEVLSLITVVASEKQLLCNQKQQQISIKEEHLTTITVQLSLKKIKSCCQLQSKTNTVYWNLLFKLRLTRQTLNKINRQNRKQVSSVRFTVARNLN